MDVGFGPTTDLAEWAGTGPSLQMQAIRSRSPKTDIQRYSCSARGAPHTFVTTETFLATFDLPSLRDLPELSIMTANGVAEASQ